MKKIIILILLTIGIYPTIENSQISITLVSVASAQSEGDEYLCGDPPEDYYYDPGQYQEPSAPPDDEIPETYTPDEQNWINDNSGDDTGGDYGDNPYDPYVEDPDWACWFYGGSSCGGGSPTPPTSTPRVDAQYYLTVDANTTKYYPSDKIYLLKENKDVTLYLHLRGSTATPVISSSGSWTISSSVVSTGFDSAPYSVRSVKTNDPVVVNISPGVTLKVSINVLDQTTIIFSPVYVQDAATLDGNAYLKSCAFDDEGWQYTSLSGDYINTLNSATYNVPWMSITDNTNALNKFAYFSLEKSVITAADAANTSFAVDLVASNPCVLINSLTSSTFHLSHTELLDHIANKTSVEVKGTESNLMASHIRDVIEAKDNATTPNVIGKMQISVQKPVKKKLLIVYVKSGASSSFRDGSDFKKIPALNYFNAYSHNQIYREWELVNTNSSSQVYPVYMDLTGLTGAALTAFNTALADKTGGNAMSLLLAEYQKLNYVGTSIPVDLSVINPNSTLKDDDDPLSSTPNVKTHIVFITDFSIDGGSLLGRVRAIGDAYTIMCDPGNFLDAAHELGHSLNLRHTFTPGYPNITQYTSNNFMDYTFNINRFYYYQWPLVW